MNFQNLTDGRNGSKIVGYVVAMAALAVLLSVTMAAGGVVAQEETTEVANESVDVNEDVEAIWVDTTFAALEDDTATSAADLEVIDENGTVVANTTVEGNNETVTHEFDVETDLEGAEGDFDVAVHTADETNVDGVEIGTLEYVGAGGGGLGGSGSTGLIAVAAVLVVGYVMTRD